MGEWRTPFLAILAGVLLVEVAMVALDMGPEPLLVAAVVTVAASTVWCVRSLALTTVDISQPVVAVANPPAPGADSRVRALRSSLVLGRTPGGDTDRLHATLVEVIDDQLQHAHGVDRQLQATEAHALLDPELRRFVEHPDAAPELAAASHVQRIVTLIERL